MKRCSLCQGKLVEVVGVNNRLIRYHCLACGRDYHVSEVHAYEILKRREGKGVIA